MENRWNILKVSKKKKKGGVLKKGQLTHGGGGGGCCCLICSRTFQSQDYKRRNEHSVVVVQEVEGGDFSNLDPY